MTIAKENMKNKIEVEGVLMNYSIKKDENAERKFARDGQFKVGDKYTRYSGYVDVLTNPTTGNYVRIDIDTEPKTYKSGANEGKPTALTLLMESLSKKELDSYNKTRNVATTPTVSVWGREPFNFKFDDNWYFKDDVLVETLQTKLGFANLNVGEPVAEPRFKNEFVLYGYVSDIKDELDSKENPTDRVVVNAYVPYISGFGENEKVLAFKAPLIAGVCVDEEGEYDMAQLILEEEQMAGVIGYSWKLTGSIHSWMDVPADMPQETGRKRGVGRQVKETVQGRHYSEILLEGIDILGTDGEVFSEEDIEQAVKARQILIETKRKEREEKKANGGANKGRGIGGRGGNSDATVGRASTAGATATTSTRGARRGW